MSEQYSLSDMQVYGAEDQEELEQILTAIDNALATDLSVKKGKQ